MKTLMRFPVFVILIVATGFGAAFLDRTSAQDSAASRATTQPLLKGQAAFGDWREDHPGVRRLITTADLPKPYASSSVRNTAKDVPEPSDATLQTLPGFHVERLATGIGNPRMIRTAPNGDLFIANSGPGEILIMRGVGQPGAQQAPQVFVDGLRQPFGIAFYPPGPNPQYIYVGNTDSIVRFPYRSGDLKARGPEEIIVPGLPHGGSHWTRDVAFSRDGKKMFVSVGSASNVNDNDAEVRRANILEFNPDGSGERTYASGIRNPVSLAINPTTGAVWTSVNERDELGDDLPPDYITHVTEGGFYGWPWYYLGPNQDPRHEGKHPELKDKIVVPDVLLQAHSASLGMVFYTGSQFPPEYRGDAFAGEHGSWNRDKRTGYKIIRIPMKDGKAIGEYQDFVTGFVTPDGNVWGRPVAVTVAADGSLVFTDDVSSSVWRVSYTGHKQTISRSN